MTTEINIGVSLDDAGASGISGNGQQPVSGDRLQRSDGSGDFLLLSDGSGDNLLRSE